MTSTSSKNKSIDRNILLLFASYGMVLLAGFNTGWIGPLLPAIAKIHSIPIQNLGSLFSVQFLGCVITMILAKKTIDWLGVRKSILAATVFTLVGFMLMSIQSLGPILLWVGALMIGCGAGYNSIAGTIAALRLDKSNAATSLNKLHLFFGLGALIGPLIAWGAYHTPWSYSTAYIFGAVIAVLFLILVFASHELPQRQTSREAPPSKTTLKSVNLWLFSFSMFFYVGIETGAGAWLYTFLTRASELPQAQAALGMSALWLGLSTGRFISGNLCKRYSPKYVVLTFMLLTLSMLVLLSIQPHFSIFTLLIVLLIGLGFGPTFPTIIAMVTSKYNHSEALVSTVSITTGFAGGMIYPWAAGHIFHDWGMQQGMIFLSTGAAIMVGLFMLANKIKDNTSEDSLGSKVDFEKVPTN